MSPTKDTPKKDGLLEKQVAIFPKNLQLEPSDLDYIEAQLRTKNLADEGNDRIRLLIPPEIDRAVPRMVFSRKITEESFFKCHIAFDRIDFYRKFGSQEDINPTLFAEFRTYIESVLAIIHSKDSIRVKRVGYISTYHMLSQDPVQHIGFIDDNLKKKLYKVDLNFTYNYGAFEDYGDCNLVYLFSDGQVEGKNALVLRTDFNTHQEQDAGWNIHRAIKFIESAETHITSNNDLYTIFNKYLINETKQR